MAKIIKITQGPRRGPQEYVRYCPNCRGDLRVPEPKEKPNRYQCCVCEREFEIIDLYIELATE